MASAVFAVLANKRKIDEATAQKDDPAPVYLLEELWQIVSTSGPETAAGFVDYVLKRLASKSPVVKHKTLRLIKFLCAKGNSDFRRQMAKNAQPIRELQHFRGGPDAFKGDAPNQRVRETAKEALDALFAPPETVSYADLRPSATQSRIQGFGSANASDGFAPAATARPPAGMLGFGNPRFEGGSVTTGGGGRSSRGYEPVGEAGGARGEGLGSMIQRVGSGALSPKAIMDSIAARGNEFLQGRRGPGILRDHEQGGYSSDEADRGYERPASNGGSRLAAGAGAAAAARAPASDGSEEARLVDQVCTPGGLRAQPTADDLAVFVDSAGGLSGPVLAERLEDKMVGTSWQAALRAICALEAVIQRGSTASCGEIAVHFQSSPAALQRASGSPQASVRQRATRVLTLLGVSGSSSAAPAAAAAPVPDLLGGMGEEPPVPATAAAAPSAADLLGDLMAPAPAAAAAPAAAPAQADGGMFSGLDLSGPAQPQQQQQQQQAAGGLDLFSGLDAPAPASAPQPPAQPASDMDLLAGLSAPSSLGGGGGNAFATAASAQPAPELDLFGGPATSTSAAPAAELSEMFASLSAGNGGGSGAPSQPRRQPTPQQLAAQRQPSLERAADPLSALSGLQQAPSAPMGYGASAQQQQGGSPAAAMPAMAGAGQPGADWPGMPQQLTPQQAQYLRQLQYYQYMQMQAMQARGMASGGGGMPQFAQQQQQQQAGAFPQLGAFQQPQQPLGFGQPQQQLAPHAPAAGPNGSGPIGLESLLGGSGSISGGSAAPLTQSSSLGITQRSDFDFVGDHVKSLRGKK